MKYIKELRNPEIIEINGENFQVIENTISHRKYFNNISILACDGQINCTVYGC
jgi:hypothetical protein